MDKKEKKIQESKLHVVVNADTYNRLMQIKKLLGESLDCKVSFDDIISEALNSILDNKTDNDEKEK